MINLFLDHFFAGVDSAGFDGLKILKDLIPLTEVRTTTTADDTWSGVYLFAASGMYFEMLSRIGDRKKAGFGLAFSRLGHEKDVEKCLSAQFPGLGWTSKEILRNGTEPWFTCVYPRKQLSDERIWTWGMEYRGAARDARRSEVSAKEALIEEFLGMEIEVPADLFDRLSGDLHRWIPASKRVFENRYEALIQCDQGKRFRFEAVRAGPGRLANVRRVYGTLRTEGNLKPIKQRAFSLSVRGREFELAF